MEQVRRATGAAASGRTALGGLHVVLRAASLALQAMLRPRGQPLSGFSDRQLADIGLTRADVERPHERTASAELEMQRLLRGRNWW